MSRWPRALALECAAGAEAAASVLRHDMGNRLAAIRNAAAFLRRKLEGADIWREEARIARFLDLIDSESAAANQILRERVTFEPLLRPELGVLALDEVVRETLREIDASARLERADEVRVVGDCRQLRLLVLCLVDAVAGEGGWWIRVAREGELAVVEVSGQRQGSGAWLGLSIASSVVRRHEGELRIEARQSGDVARVSLPLAQADSPP